MSVSALAMVQPRGPQYPGNTRQRGREKWAIVSEYLERWHISNADLLTRIVGLESLGSRRSISALVKRGLLRQVDYGNNVVVYMLTLEGLARTPRHSDVWYNIRPSSLKPNEVLHDLSVQRLALRYSCETVPARLLLPYYQERFAKALEHLRHNIVAADMAKAEACSTWPLRYWLVKEQLSSGKPLDPKDVDRYREHTPDPESERAYRALDDACTEARRTYTELQETKPATLARPDLLVIDGSARTAIEVERSPKNRRRWIEIYGKHCINIKLGFYQRVEYHCSSFADRMRKIADEKLEPPFRDCFTFTNHPEIF